MSLQFGRYVIKNEVTDELGRGAFGRVYRAFDPNVNRYVAVKVLSSQSDPEMLNRFRDESKTAGKLDHENIVKVYDAELQDGVPYLVMELLDGETLEVVIRNRLMFGRPLEILDKVEIEQTPGVNLDDRLRMVPGFTLFRRSSSIVANPTTQGVSLRGIGSSGASRTLVLWDGIPINDPFGSSRIGSQKFAENALNR